MTERHIVQLIKAKLPEQEIDTIKDIIAAYADVVHDEYSQTFTNHALDFLVDHGYRRSIQRQRDARQNRKKNKQQT